MGNIRLSCVAVLLLAVSSSLASLLRHASQPAVRGNEPNYGSYIVTSDGSFVTFLNFKTSDCSGPFTTFSDAANQCGVEFFPAPVARNFSWNALVNDTHMHFNNFPNPTCTEPALLSRFYTLGACEPCPNEICKNGLFAPEMSLGKLSGTSMPWLENHWHTAPGVAFATSMNAGAVFKYTYDAEADCVTKATCNATYEEWLSGYKAVSGIVGDPRDDSVVALATNLQTGVNELIKFNATDSAVPVEVIATFDDLYGNLTTNGLARNDKWPDVLYATNFANYSLFAGTILAIDTQSGQIVTFATGLTAPDGAYVLNGKLYVSEVLFARVLVYDVSTDPLNPVKETSYVPPGVKSLDDFAAVELSDGRTYIIGADYLGNRVASWPADGPVNASEVRILAAGLDHPTSVRPEFVRQQSSERLGYARRFVTVTQGGNFPAAPYGHSNNGAFYRLRVEPLPQPVHSAGSLIHLTHSDANCQSIGTTGYSKPLDLCMPESASASTLIQCNASSVVIETFGVDGSTCSGTPSNVQTSTPFQCYTNADGTSYMELCAAL